MSSTQEFVDHVVDQIGIANTRYRKMFGEYALYIEEKVVGLICDDTLFIKQVVENKSLAKKLKLGPAYPGAKDSYIISEQYLEDRTWLKNFVEITAKALPKVIKKKPTRKKI